MAVRIRMKLMGRRHRPFYRICAMNVRAPRDGRVLEELGTYDPMVPLTDARTLLNGERVQYWLGVGALPTEKVKVLIQKYGAYGTHVQKQKAALDQLAQMRRRTASPAYLGKPAQTASAAVGAEDGAEDAEESQPAGEE